jgi:hypothetical protein
MPSIAVRAVVELADLPHATVPPFRHVKAKAGVPFIIMAIWGGRPPSTTRMMMYGSRRIVFLWIEVGGPVVARPRRLGFGTALIQRIAQAQNVAVRIDYSAVSDVSFRRRWNTARDKNVQKA